LQYKNLVALNDSEGLGIERDLADALEEDQEISIPVIA
jgi:hypothetical protein